MFNSDEISKITHSSLKFESPLIFKLILTKINSLILILTKNNPLILILILILTKINPLILILILTKINPLILILILTTFTHTHVSFTQRTSFFLGSDPPIEIMGDL